MCGFLIRRKYLTPDEKDFERKRVCGAGRQKKVCQVNKEMAKKTVACLTPERLRELAQEPNNVVYTQVHDIQYTAWSGAKVKACVNKLVALTRSGTTPDAIRAADPELADFASKYTVFFASSPTRRLSPTPPACTVLELVQLKTMVDSVDRGAGALAARPDEPADGVAAGQPQRTKNETTVEAARGRGGGSLDIFCA